MKLHRTGALQHVRRNKGETGLLNYVQVIQDILRTESESSIQLTL